MTDVIKSKRLRTEARTHFALYATDPDTVDLLVEGLLDVVHGMRPKDEEEASLFLETKAKEYLATFGVQLAQMTATPTPRTRGGMRFTHSDSRKANRLVARCIATAGTLATLFMLCVGCHGYALLVPVHFAGTACMDTHDDGSTVAHTLHLGLHSDSATHYRLEVDGDGATYLLPAREIDGDESLKARVDTGVKHAWADVRVRVASRSGDEWVITDDVGQLAACPAE